MLTIDRRTASWIFGAIAAIALIGTWGNNRHYLSRGFITANKDFWSDAVNNPASRFVAVDMFLLGLAVLVWMVFEARRLEIRFVWLYILLGFLVAISVTVPVFLIARERALATREPGSPAGSMSRVDAALLYLLALGCMVFAGYAIAR